MPVKIVDIWSELDVLIFNRVRSGFRVPWLNEKRDYFSEMSRYTYWMPRQDVLLKYVVVVVVVVVVEPRGQVAEMVVMVQFSTLLGKVMITPVAPFTNMD